MIKKVFSATLFIFLSITVSFSQNQEQERWVDSVYNALTLEQRIGQLFMIRVHTDSTDQYLSNIHKLIKKGQIGSIMFMSGDPVKQVHLTNKFQSGAGLPVLVGMELESGAGTRLKDMVEFPPQMTLGAIYNDSLIYALGAEIARQMKILGVHLNMAPVADINTLSNNSVTGMNAFGSDKNLVANKAIAYMRGIQENGSLACAKHFPGQGDIKQQTSLTLPLITHEEERLDSIEMYPFKKLIYAGTAALMTAHINLPALDKQRNMPASLSPKIITEILREELLYEGLVITDALDLRAITDFHKPGEAEVLALKAGNDILNSSSNIIEATRLIKKNVSKKKIPPAQFEKSVKRVIRAKYKAGLAHWQSLNTDNIALRINSPRADLLNQTLAEKAITVVNNVDALLPVSIIDGKSYASLSVGTDVDFAHYLDKYAPFSHFVKGKDDVVPLHQQLRYYDVVVVGIAKLDQSQGSNGISQELLQLLDRLHDDTQLIICLFDSPYSLLSLQGYKHVICAYDENEYTLKSVPAAIFGGIATNAKLPVKVSDQVAFGHGQDTKALGRLSYSLPEGASMDHRVLEQIDDIAREAIVDHATPGCQVIVARKGKIVFEKAYGYQTYDSIIPIDDYTIYDIASITKVLSTMQAIMFLEERGMIDLDKKISVYLPELRGTNKEHMIIRDILTHQAGLWPYLPFWKRTIEDSFLMNGLYKNHPEMGFDRQVSDEIFTTNAMQDSVWVWVKESKLRDKISRRPYDYKYSDMGYYIMQKMIEKMVNQPMADFLKQNFYDPLGLTTLGYLPLCNFPLDRIAPTEQDDYFRNTLVYGLVHDQGAALCGGIAGHAGLFSSAIDLAKMMQMHLQDGQYGGVTFFQPGTVEKFTTKQYDTSRRGIGWDKPAIGNSNGPTSFYASGRTFGHTGFTGTAVWADPEFDLIYVFLSNRIHPDANNTKLIRNNIRTRIQNVIYESIWSFEQYGSYEN